MYLSMSMCLGLAGSSEVISERISPKSAMDCIGYGDVDVFRIGRYRCTRIHQTMFLDTLVMLFSQLQAS